MVSVAQRVRTQTPQQNPTPATLAPIRPPSLDLSTIRQSGIPQVGNARPPTSLPNPGTNVPTVNPPQLQARGGFTKTTNPAQTAGAYIDVSKGGALNKTGGVYTPPKVPKPTLPKTLPQGVSKQGGVDIQKTPNSGQSGGRYTTERNPMGTTATPGSTFFANENFNDDELKAAETTFADTGGMYNTDPLTGIQTGMKENIRVHNGVTMILNPKTGRYTPVPSSLAAVNAQTRAANQPASNQIQLHPGQGYNDVTGELFGPGGAPIDNLGPNAQVSGANITPRAETAVPKPDITRTIRQQGLVGPQTEKVEPDAGNVNQFVNETFPTVGHSSTASNIDTGGGTSMSFSPGKSKKEILSGKAPKTIKQFLNDDGIKNGSIDGSGFAFKNFGKTANSQAQADAYAKGVQERFAQSGDPNLQQIRPQVIKGKNGGWNVVFKKSDFISNLKINEPAGNQENITNQTETVNTVNEGVQDIIKQILPLILQSQQTQGKTFAAAAEGLGREIPGVGETSPEQEAQVTRGMDAFRGEQLEAIERAMQERTNAHRMNLKSKGMLNSSLEGQIYENDVERPSNLDARGLVRSLAQEEQNIRNSIAGRQNAGVDTLGKIGAPQFPSNVPKPAELQEGTFQKTPSLAEQTQLLTLISYLMPKADQDTKRQIMESFMNNTVVPVSDSSIFSDLVSAGGTMAGAALGNPGAFNSVSGKIKTRRAA